MNAQPANAALQKRLGAFYTGEPTACSRFRLLGNETIWGIDVSKDALKLAHERVDGAKLVHSDFFKLSPGAFASFDCIVGNPTFIRYVVVCSNLNRQRRRVFLSFVPRTALFKQVLQRLAQGADGNFEKVAEIVDQFLLRRFLGLSTALCGCIKTQSGQHIKPVHADILEAKFDASSGCSWEPRLSSNDEDAKT
jgi:methylase of polypeptide subunit release factors